MSESQPAELPPPRFRRTKTDKWAVVAPVATLEAALQAGGVVAVQRKSGEWSTFTVASLGRPFDADGVSMCYGYGPDDEGDAGAVSTPPRRQPPGNRPGPKAQPPPRDESEPLPEYRGGPEDEWQGEF